MTCGKYRWFAIGLTQVLLASSLASCSLVERGYREENLTARERDLRIALAQLREGINVYREDQGAPPSTLDEIVKAGYMSELPRDPFTAKSDWIVVLHDCSKVQGCKLGIQNVHSASKDRSTEGTLYNEW